MLNLLNNGIKTLKKKITIRYGDGLKLVEWLDYG